MQQTFTHNIAVEMARKKMQNTKSCPTTSCRSSAFSKAITNENGTFKIGILFLFLCNESFTLIFMGRGPVNQSVMCRFEVIVAFASHNGWGRFEVVMRLPILRLSNVRSSDMVGQNGGGCRFRNAWSSVTPTVLLAWNFKGFEGFLKLESNASDEDLPTRCRARTQDSMAEESVCCRFDQNSSGLFIVERRLRAFVTAS